MALVLFVLVVVSVLALSVWIVRRPRNFPPGPHRWPLLGSSLSLPRSHPHLTMEQWRYQYGPMVGLVLGPVALAVTVCEPDAVFEVLRNDDFQGRPDGRIFRERTFDKRLGVIFNDGPMWVKQRRFMLRNMRDFGFGKPSMESRILEEIEDLLRLLKSEGTVQVSDLFTVHMVNILWAVTAGTRFEPHDARLIKLLDGVNKVFRAGSPTGNAILRTIPYLKYMAPRLTGYDTERKSRTELQEFIREAIHEHLRTLDVSNPRDFIDVYLTEIQNNEDPTFSEDGLVAIIFDLFGAGAESVSNTLGFALLYMVLYPEVQKKAQKELDSVVGRSRRISLEDRPRLPYLEAVIAEVSRINTIAPMCPPHMALTDTKLNGYNIPKGTMLFVSLWSVLHDASHWGDPEDFRPERFIDKATGNFVRDPYLINFGIGTRTCVGLPLARNNLFLFLGVLLQEFTMSVPAGDPVPSTEALPGITTAPKPFRVSFRSR